MSCIFCRLIRGEVHSKIVYENSDCLAIVPTTPEADGHLLLMPKVHAVEFEDISEDCLSKLILFVKLVCENIKTEYGASGFNVLHASGQSAQQSVPHFHIHVIPRFDNDGINAWPELSDGKDIYE